MTKAWKTASATVLSLLFYFIYLVVFGSQEPASPVPSSTSDVSQLLIHSLTDLSTLGLLGLLSLFLALMALYLPKRVRSPAVIVLPLVGSGVIDFYLSLSAPFEFFVLLYGVVPFIASGNLGLVGAGVAGAAIYSALALSQKSLNLWIPFLLLIPLGAVFAAAKEDLISRDAARRAGLAAFTILVLIPFPLIALDTGSSTGLMLYSAAMLILVAGLVLQARCRDISWIFYASGVIAYFTPLVLFTKLGFSTYSDYNVVVVIGESYLLFIVGTFVVPLYLYFLNNKDVRKSYYALVATPVLLGITAALVVRSNLYYYFASLGPWLVVAVAAPRSTYLRSLLFPSPIPYSSPQHQQRASPQPVTFEINGLPPGAIAIVTMGTVTCSGNPEIRCYTSGGWTAFQVYVGNVIYHPYPDSGYAKPGDIVYITYVPAPVPSPQPAPPGPQQPQQTPIPGNTPSRPLGRVNPTEFKPDNLVNRQLGAYTVKRLIACGGFGCVYEAEMSSGEKYAIKIIKLEKGGDPVAYFRDLENEKQNLIALSNHPNIVKFYGIHSDIAVIERILKGDLSLYYTDPPRIVMEFMEGGNLEDYLYQDAFFYSTSWEAAVRKAVRQIADALAHVHGKGYVHSDVKPQNVFLTRKPKDPSDLLSVDFKLGDLGSAVRAGKYIGQLTIEYSPPEVYVEPARPSMDVFALGITLYVLLTRKNDRPDLQAMNEAFDCYVNGDKNCAKLKVEEAKRLLASWDPQVPEPYKSLIKRMTDPDPAKRPTALEVAKALA